MLSLLGAGGGLRMTEQKLCFVTFYFELQTHGMVLFREPGRLSSWSWVPGPGRGGSYVPPADGCLLTPQEYDVGGNLGLGRGAPTSGGLWGEGGGRRGAGDKLDCQGAQLCASMAWGRCPPQDALGQVGGWGMASSRLLGAPAVASVGWACS